MKMRKISFWLITILITIYTLLDTIPSNYTRTMDVFYNHKYVALRIMKDTMQLLSIYIAFLCGDCLLKDERLGISEMMASTSLKKREYIYGKFIGNISISTAILFIVTVICTIPQIFMHPNAFELKLYVMSFIILGIIPVIFISGLATYLPYYIRSSKVFLVIFILYWALCEFAEFKGIEYIKYIGYAKFKIFQGQGISPPELGPALNMCFLLAVGIIPVVVLANTKYRKDIGRILRLN